MQQPPFIHPYFIALFYSNAAARLINVIVFFPVHSDAFMVSIVRYSRATARRLQS